MFYLEMVGRLECGIYFKFVKLECNSSHNMALLPVSSYRDFFCVTKKLEIARAGNQRLLLLVGGESGHQCKRKQTLQIFNLKVRACPELQPTQSVLLALNTSTRGAVLSVS